MKKNEVKMVRATITFLRLAAIDADGDNAFNAYAHAADMVEAMLEHCGETYVKFD